MALSYTQIKGDGTTRTFSFSFAGQDEGYIRESDIVVMVDGAETPYTMTSSNTLELSSAPANGAIVIIRRVTPVEQPYADFSRGNSFSPDTLNNSFLQILYLVHELLDGWFPEGFSFKQTVELFEDLTVNGNIYVGGEIFSIDGEGYFKRFPTENDLQEIRDAYTSADANLQAQITGDTPLEASAFSEISWHGQVIENSVSIPRDKNAWSFGPVVEISQGSIVTVGQGSYWTIAEGEGEGAGGGTGGFDGNYDYGELT